MVQRLLAPSREDPIDNDPLQRNSAIETLLVGSGPAQSNCARLAGMHSPNRLEFVAESRRSIEGSSWLLQPWTGCR